MSDDTESTSGEGDLLEELDSLKSLLHEEQVSEPPTVKQPSVPPQHANEIGSVEEYFAIKQQASEHDQGIEEYLQAQVQKSATEQTDYPSSEELNAVALPDEEEEEDIPSLSDMISEAGLGEELEFASTEQGSPKPQQHEFEPIPVLEQTIESVPLLEPGTGEDTPMDDDEVQQLVALLLERRLQALRPQLEQEILEELQKLQALGKEG